MKSLPLKQKIFNAIENERLNLVEGTKKRYNYTLSTQYLYHARNNFDGFAISVFDKEKCFLEEITIDIRTVCEYGAVHNKMFLL